MGRFETQWLAVEKNLSALTDFSSQWIDAVHGRRPPRGIVLDIDSSVSPTHGEQENSIWNGHYRVRFRNVRRQDFWLQGAAQTDPPKSDQ
jgi:hypothetical protein